MNNSEKFEKLEHTLCLNIPNLKFGIDTYLEGPNNTPIDCANVYEMLDYLDDLVPAIEYFDLLDKAMPDMRGFYNDFVVEELGYNYYKAYWRSYTRYLLDENEFNVLLAGIRYSYLSYENESEKVQNEN